MNQNGRGLFHLSSFLLVILQLENNRVFLVFYVGPKVRRGQARVFERNDRGGHRVSCLGKPVGHIFHCDDYYFVLANDRPVTLAKCRQRVRAVRLDLSGRAAALNGDKRNGAVGDRLAIVSHDAADNCSFFVIAAAAAKDQRDCEKQDNTSAMRERMKEEG